MWLLWKRVGQGGADRGESSALIQLCLWLQMLFLHICSQETSSTLPSPLLLKLSWQLLSHSRGVPAGPSWDSETAEAYTVWFSHFFPRDTSDRVFKELVRVLYFNKKKSKASVLVQWEFYIFMSVVIPYDSKYTEAQRKYFLKTKHKKTFLMHSSHCYLAKEQTCKRKTSSLPPSRPLFLSFLLRETGSYFVALAGVEFSM